MLINKKNFFVFGLLLTIVGTFLPWEVEGDFLFQKINGIQVFPSFEDNGGLAILLLSIVIALIFFSPQLFSKIPKKLLIILCAILPIIVIFHLVNVFSDSIQKRGVVGAPSIQYGLVLVLIGSIIQSLLSISQLMVKSFIK
jgi:MFS superfamily sulfate permease-like transporter